MKLEEEISQPHFKSEYHKANVNLIYTSYWLMNRIKTNLQEHDITHQQYNVLRILRGQNGKPISTSDIRNRMLDRMSDVSRIVDRLHKQDLVTRKICPSDKRLVDVAINDKGLKLLKQIDPTQDAIERLLALDEKEVQQLNALLDKARG